MNHQNNIHYCYSYKVWHYRMAVMLPHSNLLRRYMMYHSYKYLNYIASLHKGIRHPLLYNHIHILSPGTYHKRILYLMRIESQYYNCFHAIRSLLLYLIHMCCQKHVDPYCMLYNLHHCKSYSKHMLYCYSIHHQSMSAAFDHYIVLCY